MSLLRSIDSDIPKCCSTSTNTDCGVDSIHRVSGQQDFVVFNKYTVCRENELHFNQIGVAQLQLRSLQSNISCLLSNIPRDANVLHGNILILKESKAAARLPAREEVAFSRPSGCQDED